MIGKDDGWKIKIELDSINCTDDGYPGYYLNDGLPFIPRIGEGLYLNQSILDELDNHNHCPKCINKEECRRDRNNSFIPFTDDANTVTRVHIYLDTKEIVITIGNIYN